MGDYYSSRDDHYEDNRYDDHYDNYNYDSEDDDILGSDPYTPLY